MKSAYFTFHPGKNPPPQNGCRLKFVLFFKNIGFTFSTFPIQPDFSRHQPAAITLNTGSPQISPWRSSPATSLWPFRTTPSVPKWLSYPWSFFLSLHTFWDIKLMGGRRSLWDGGSNTHAQILTWNKYLGINFVASYVALVAHFNAYTCAWQILRAGKVECVGIISLEMIQNHGG